MVFAERGLQGPAGANGTNGTNGSNGTNGANGAAGATGPAGPTGVVSASATAPLTLAYDSANKAIHGSVDLSAYAQLAGAEFTGSITIVDEIAMGPGSDIDGLEISIGDVSGVDNNTFLQFDSAGGKFNFFNGDCDFGNRTLSNLLALAAATEGTITENSKPVAKVTAGTLGTLTWGGTTAPSGTITKEFVSSQNGRMITVWFKIAATVAGSGITSLSFPLPSALPIPAMWASQPSPLVIAPAVLIGFTSALGGTIVSAARLERNSGGTYQFNGTISSAPEYVCGQFSYTI